MCISAKTLPGLGTKMHHLDGCPRIRSPSVFYKTDTCTDQRSDNELKVSDTTTSNSVSEGAGGNNLNDIDCHWSLGGTVGSSSDSGGRLTKVKKVIEYLNERELFTRRLEITLKVLERTIPVHRNGELDPLIMERGKQLHKHMVSRPLQKQVKNFIDGNGYNYTAQRNKIKDLLLQTHSLVSQFICGRDCVGIIKESFENQLFREDRVELDYISKQNRVKRQVNLNPTQEMEDLQWKELQFSLLCLENRYLILKRDFRKRRYETIIDNFGFKHLMPLVHAYNNLFQNLLSSERNKFGASRLLGGIEQEIKEMTYGNGLSSILAVGKILKVDERQTRKLVQTPICQTSKTA